MKSAKSNSNKSTPASASKPDVKATASGSAKSRSKGTAKDTTRQARTSRTRVLTGNNEPRPEVGNPSAPRYVPSPDFPIVGIGGSAGGLEALNELFEKMPADTGLAFVVVTHQPSGRISLLPELLGRETSMPVGAAVEGTKLQPNRVYVCPPGGQITIVSGMLHVTDIGPREGHNLPIDQFFRSLAEDQQGNAICIVLSGTGTDGTQGLRAVKGNSGMAMVQQPQTAKYAGMPSSAIATNLADYVLAPCAMPQQLIDYARSPSLRRAAAKPTAVPPQVMQTVFELLRARTGNDFSSYKASTIHRRVERRMSVHQIEQPEDYVRHLQQDPREIDILFNELLISVTSFFRDPQAWDALVPLLDQLIESRSDKSTLRVWVPGCSTGEEVYSLAMILRECLDKTGRRTNVQIFGTDLDADAIETARIGQYPDGIEKDVSPGRLEQDFVHHNGFYRIRKEIREMAVFAPQNLIKDPPFTRLDMIACRNLLIYLNSDLQKRLLPIFHYAMKPGGLLFQGPSETVGMFTDLFETLDKRWKILRRKESATAIRRLPEMPAQLSMHDSDSAVQSIVRPPVKHTYLSAVIERSLLNKFAPVCIVVNDHGEIAFIHGRTGTYLEASQGQPRVNVLDMAREGLQIELAAAIRDCVTDGKDVLREGIRVRTNGEFTQVDLTVTKLHEPEALHGLLLVTFQTAPAGPQRRASPKKKASGGAAENDPVERMERELRSIRESQQSMIAELETSNEDLKSANEESQSANEELQSANEELETSAEEMQSLNEELTAVNTELQSKLDELTQTNNDMQNLLNSTDIATIFLDQDLNIKRFTDPAKLLVMLRPSDLGRPITELSSSLTDTHLAESCREVLKTLVSAEHEVVTKDNAWYLMRILPYRTTENVVAGIVITFVNIKQLKDSQKAEASRLYFESIFDTVRQPLVVLDTEHRVVSANSCFYSTFRTRPAQMQNQRFWEVGDGAWNTPALRELLEEILPQKSSFEGFEVQHEFPKIGHKVFLLNARRLEQSTALPDLILLAFEDVTSKTDGRLNEANG